MNARPGPALAALASLSILAGAASAQDKQLPVPGEVFSVGGRTAFAIEPAPAARPEGPLPWVWYAPTLPGLPAAEEAWMFERLLAAGVAVAGIDVGESYGSPSGRAGFQALYEHLTGERGYAPRPVLLARSRGGLMLYNWAVEHPRSVGGVAGIYPVCSLVSYPGLERAAPAYGTSPARLQASLAAHDPIERLSSLARLDVPILHLHGDQDRTVPLEANSAELARRYTELGGPAEVLVVEGRGHDLWSGWFQSRELLEFAITRALDGRRVRADEPRGESTEPLPVYVLLGQSNMLGFGRVEPEEQRGTLAHLTRVEGRFPHLVDGEGGWAVRDDVWYARVTVGQRQHWLQPMGRHIGPELQFGHVLGDHHEGPVLVLEASQGNRSLGWDILPPGSERFTFEGRTYAGYGDTPSSWVEGEEAKPVNWYAGKQYDDFVRDLHEVLDDLPRFFPDYDGRGYEVAGFAWWQGHKDQNPAHASRYEANLVRLIGALREEFEAPEAPFVLATIAFGGWELSGPGLAVAEAQLRVSGESGAYPAFAGNVATVEARDFWRGREVSPSGQGHHYNQNAETYLLVGDALGRAMVELLEAGE